MMRHIPMIPLQRAVYEALSTYQTAPVYDDVPEDATPPAVSFGSFTAKQSGAKALDAWDVSMQLDLWSNYAGKKQIQEMADDVASVLTSVKLDLSADGFEVLSCDVDFFEAFPEDEVGYHGVLTFVAKIQYVGG
ncbi:DUF3168 domain-containing protein [Pyramidobacter sp. C12-8]|uniref:DUF3168 domain-containing protein n=1 Tax=Pyramidobacter sp. C12-8 TaxID=1943580 RepID=UPI00098F3A8B|nr:DUF3168 domain-containing protein [Pyramidobacter sp. C12-8]OON87807.1 hypothetical protein B0D78_09370 [Pyramidobacter sp. C12-8]